MTRGDICRERPGVFVGREHVDYTTQNSFALASNSVSGIRPFSSERVRRRQRLSFGAARSVSWNGDESLGAGRPRRD